MATINSLGNGLSGITGTGSFVGSTNGTITTPRIAQINDTNGNEMLVLNTVASAVNHISITNSITGTAPTISAAGDNINVNLFMSGKGGSGHFIVVGGADPTKRLSLEVAAGTTGTQTSIIAAQTAARTITLPDATDTLVGKATTDTLSNKTLTNPIISGNMTQPTMPAFLAYNSSGDTNQTGNGAVATVDFDTEIFDRGADFALDTFTSPITAIYPLNATVGLSNITAAADTVRLNIVTSNRTYTSFLTRTNGLGSVQNMQLSILADMDASDTATVTVTVTGEAGDTVAITGGTPLATVFSGYLVG